MPGLFSRRKKLIHFGFVEIILVTLMRVDSGMRRTPDITAFGRCSGLALAALFYHGWSIATPDKRAIMSGVEIC